MDEMITDYITGKTVRNAGPEASRQLFEKWLVEKKGYEKSDIRVDEPLTVQFKGQDYVSSVDLIVWCGNRPFMAVICVAGSIGSYEREILSAARLVHSYQVPFAVSTDARDAVIMDTLSGKTVGKGLEALPDKPKAAEMSKALEYEKLDDRRREREMIIFRSFNLERVNV